ncbi:MAG: hypothetical protein US96_C0018G0030 [Candidatus Woesebacteria bacterium GW2011_GWB1_38_5b]|uniref:Uncharacterized protein n=2 Tax=Candidatus Woeseibacteriota TaxID=1752722 RepID=A0A0G0K5S9_9BACT|nr:MAG: hypothetical protein US96_C0018G0030 [Candidatus Woesebacteria bacterium GW2011_GWB1_38_5b]OGM19280.1 MAG: hypothetical protein A2686_04820 [Candidatus Woesebacteria bacterium RIFCSPHIGHO2_01_FULL_38_10]OGM59455.1 MAG: hypothetical protein A2892_02295 [Candidatus Woesebacteria bacterium RIFCSPLOWO2_01_FULL_39_10b]
MKKETTIVLFYILYFGWLFTVIFLTQEVKIVNYFTAVITLFYFIFLRERSDILWFFLGGILVLFLSGFSFTRFKANFDKEEVKLVPYWLPMAWGTTFVALRKLYLLIAR